MFEEAAKLADTVWGAVAVGSPRCFESHPRACIAARPAQPEMHQLPPRLRRRIPLGFRQGQQLPRRRREGPLIVDDVEILIRAALDGVSLAYMSEERAAPHFASGALVRVLEDWCQPFPGFFL